MNVSACMSVSGLVFLSPLEKGVGREAVCMFFCVLNFKAQFFINTF